MRDLAKGILLANLGWTTICTIIVVRSGDEVSAALWLVLFGLSQILLAPLSLAGAAYLVMDWAMEPPRETPSHPEPEDLNP